MIAAVLVAGLLHLQPGDPTSPGGPTQPPTLPTMTQNPQGDGTRVSCLPSMYSCGWSQR